VTGKPPVGEVARPLVPPRTNRLPTLLLWFVPFLLIILYFLVVLTFFHAEAAWTGDRLIQAAILLIVVNAAFSVVWFSLAYVASILLGEYVGVGILRLIAKFPGLNRHVVVTPPRRPDSAQEVWGRFGILLLITLGFELIFLLLIVQQGDLAPRLAVERPFRFFPVEVYAGLGLALLLAPAAPFLGSRLRTRITDSLEFPLLWLAVLLIAVGGSSILLLEVLPGFVFTPALFFTSILLYAPAAWYVCLAFSAAEERAQQRFLRRAWKSRDPRFHFGRLKVTDEPEGTTTDV
jgi:hypothetical protein